MYVELAQKEINNLESANVDERIILNCILKTECVCGLGLLNLVQFREK
jgi:hypothetical protein